MKDDVKLAHEIAKRAHHGQVDKLVRRIFYTLRRWHRLSRKLMKKLLPIYTM